MSDLTYEVNNHLTRITMNRPERLNYFSGEMIQLWATALEDIRDRGDVRVVFLSGSGRALCAGGDVKATATGEGLFESSNDITSIAPARKNVLWGGVRRIPLVLEEIDEPAIAKVHGAAVGAGLDMALIHDVCIASESAPLPESYFNAKVVPGDGGAYFLPHLAGRDKVLNLLLTARVLRGAEAEKIGLVTHVVPDDQLDDYIEQYIQKLMDASQQTMRLTKRAIDQSEQSSLRSSLDLVSSFMGTVTGLGDYHTRTAALVECLNRKSEA